MNKKTLICFIIIIINCSCISKINDKLVEDSSFFPLSLGNKWVYINSLDNKSISHMDTIIDTIFVMNNKYYWVKQYILYVDSLGDTIKTNEYNYYYRQNNYGHL